MSGRFKDVPLLPPDSIIDLNRQIKADANPRKVDLGIGAYRDSAGKPYILSVVKAAEARAVADPAYNHEYIPIEGYAPFRQGSQQVLFGAAHPVVAEGRVATVQALSGTGALRIGFEFLRRHVAAPVVYLPNQTWGNHRQLVQDSGIEDIRTYRYYDAATLSLDFAGLMEDLTAAPGGAIVLLHTSGHNPVGFDPSHEDWQRLAALCKEKGLLVFMDNAYQGYTSGSLEDDAFSVRLFASLGIDLFCACSFAKNMGLYGERIGALHAVAASSTEADALLSQFKAIIRPMYSSPPAHYARVAAVILNDPALYQDWQMELHGMAGRIQGMRHLFLKALGQTQCPGDWSHLARQRGMFGFTGLTPSQVAALKKEYSIYMLANGRISLSGFNEGNVQYVAQAFTEVLMRERAVTPPLPSSSSSSFVKAAPAAGADHGANNVSVVVPECEDPTMAGTGPTVTCMHVVTPSLSPPPMHP